VKPGETVKVFHGRSAGQDRCPGDSGCVSTELEKNKAAVGLYPLFGKTAIVVVAEDIR
jgi:hypothetical protein